MYKSHDGHYTYRVAGPSSADPRRRCHECREVFNPIIRAAWVAQQVSGRGTIVPDTDESRS